MSNILDLKEQYPIDKNDVWEHILNEKKYKDEESIIVSATFIKSCKASYKGSKESQFEPRLLAYYCSFNSLPNSLKNRGLSMLPIKNGEYLLGKFNVYFTLNYNNGKNFKVKKNINSLLMSIGDSEMSELAILRYSGVFERDEILGETIQFGPLLSGRHRCSFNMNILKKEIHINGVQYEVDSAYETENKILLIECKKDNKQLDSFNIKQLYYPYRQIKDKIGNKKQIICAFIHSLKGVNHIWLFEFKDDMNMNSINQTNHFTYEFI